MAPKIETQQYYKLLTDLSIEELLCYGLNHGVTKPKASQRKGEIIRQLLINQSDFLDDQIKRFHFKLSGKTLEYIETPSDAEKFKSKTAIQVNKIDIDKLKTEIDAETELAIQPADKTINFDNYSTFGDELVDNRICTDFAPAKATDQSEIIANLLEQLTAQNKVKTDKPFQFRQKLKYEPSHGVEAFIRSVESFSEANDIQDQKKLVSIAKSALNQSEDSLFLQDSLLPSEESSWELFRNKLLAILGNQLDYYRDLYNAFRRGSQKPGIAMSRLTQAYKRGYLNSNHALSEHDKNHIKIRFIDSLDNPLRGLVKAEERNLTFSTIADRAAELERCFGRFYEPNNAASLMYPEGRVQMVNSAMDQRTKQNVDLKLIELLNVLTQQNKEISQLSRNQHNEMKNMFRQNENGEGPRRKHAAHYIDTSKLQGFCFHYVKDGAHRSNGRNGFQCPYKHSGEIPQEVREACQ